MLSIVFGSREVTSWSGKGERERSLRSNEIVLCCSPSSSLREGLRSRPRVALFGLAAIAGASRRDDFSLRSKDAVRRSSPPLFSRPRVALLNDGATDRGVVSLSPTVRSNEVVRFSGAFRSNDVVRFSDAFRSNDVVRFSDAFRSNEVVRFSDAFRSNDVVRFSDAFRSNEVVVRFSDGFRSNDVVRFSDAACSRLMVLLLKDGTSGIFSFSLCVRSKETVLLSLFSLEALGLSFGAVVDDRHVLELLPSVVVTSGVDEGTTDSCVADKTPGSPTSSPRSVLVLLAVLVGLPSGRGFSVVSAIICSVASFDICPSFSFTFLMSSGRENSLLLLTFPDTAAEVVVAVVVVVVEVMLPLPPLRLVAEGAGLNEEEAELTGDGSMEEAESIHRAESRELMEPSRLLVLLPVDATWALIHGCWRQCSAVRRLLKEGEREKRGEDSSEEEEEEKRK